MVELIMEKTIYRQCSRCNLKAESKDQLFLFVKDIYKSKFYYTKNICKKCNSKSAREKKQGPILGPFYIRKCYICKTLAQDIKDMKDRFVKDKSLKAGYGNICKKCNSKKAQDHAKNFPEMFKKRTTRNRLKSNYSITIDQYNKIKNDQNDRCLICNIHESDTKNGLYVDHDHLCCNKKNTCGKCIRGLLCKSCNMGLGNFKDKVSSLKNAIIYLERC